ncbi:MAG: class I SAM-dependent methyltransferase [Planctomycetota bacterium]
MLYSNERTRNRLASTTKEFDITATTRIPLGAPRSRILESRPVHLSEEAVEYDAMVRRYLWLLNRPFVEIVSRLGLERGRVLDVGTGPGWIPIELALRHPGWEIWAVDASEDMLTRARRHAREAGVDGRVHFVHGDATDLPFETGEFDLSVSHFMLHHITRPEFLFNEMARVTRGGGRVLIKDLLRQPKWKASFLLAFSKRVLGYNEGQLRMYRESMASAFTVEEVRAALKNSRLCMSNIRGFRGLDFVVAA